MYYDCIINYYRHLSTAQLRTGFVTYLLLASYLDFFRDHFFNKKFKSYQARKPVIDISVMDENLVSLR